MAAATLVIQLGLSFGHVHGLTDGPPCTVSTSSVDNAAACAPQPQHGVQHDHDYCAICAVLAMLSGAQTASAPALLVQFVGTSVEQLTSLDTVLPQQAHVAFRSRAPPQA